MKMQVFTADMVRPLRDRIGCSQAELAKEIGCGIRSVSLWERGKVKKISYMHRQALINLSNDVSKS